MPLNANKVQVRLSLPSESLPENSLTSGDKDANSGEIRRRVQMWLAAVAEMYELCDPSSASLFWERWGYEFAVGAISGSRSINGSSDFLRTAQAAGATANPSTIERPLADGSILRMMDPIPIPWQGGWITISLTH